MAKAKLEINGMSCQHCVKTVTDALTALEGVQRAKVNLRKGEAVVHFDASQTTTANLTAAITEVGFKVVTKSEPLSLRLIGGILIALLSIVGCSDMPYIGDTGSMLTAEDVDRYITIGEDSVCLLSGDESACITLRPETEDDSRPIIHIHPGKLIYVFYREGVPILQAEIVTDTTEIIEQVSDAVEDDPQPTDDVETTVDDDTQQPDDSDTQQPDGDSETDGNGSGNGSGNGNGAGNGSGAGNGNGNGSGGVTKTVKVHGGGSATLGEIGVRDLRIKTGRIDVFDCPAGDQLSVTAYTGRGRQLERAHQHWSACLPENGNTITIFLSDHPELTCDVGPNTHYLGIVIDGVEELIIIRETCNP